MSTLRIRTLVVCLSAFLAPNALAEGVRIVTAEGGPTFASIQAAVDAAAEGDVLLVAEGTYSGFVIDGKGLSVLAVPGAAVEIGGGVAVRNLAAQQSALISGIEFTGFAYADSGLLQFEDNLGYVRVQDCSSIGGSLGLTLECIPYDGGHGASVRDCAGVAFLACELVGTEGERQDGLNGDCAGGRGGAGLYAKNSVVALYDCDLSGAQGGQAKYHAGDGGRGLHAFDSEVFSSGGSIHGGPGGCNFYPWPCVYQRGGGPGAALDLTSVLTTLDCEVLGGVGSPPGPILSGLGTHVPLTGVARSLATATIAVDAAPLQATFQGTGDDELWIVLSTELSHAYRPALLGVELALYTGALQGPFGIAPTTGLLDFCVPLGLLSPTEAQGVFVMQGLARTPFPEQRLSGARHTLVLSPTVGPDCDGSGTSDYVDVLTGASPDEDHDLIPDACEQAVAYCTAGTSAAGCVASLSGIGFPSATAASGFALVAATVEGAKDGIFFFGTSGRQANPWGNGTSYQCVVPPVSRAGLLSGSGTTGLCDGSFTQDLNAHWTAKPAHNPGPGALVQAQLWYRDPLNTSNQTTSLSNALEFTVLP